MTFHTFPIAYFLRPVYPHSSVSFVTLLLPEDDTPDVIPRHTYLRHAQYVSVNRNFRLNPKEVSGLSSLDPNQPICIPASMCPASRAGETRDRAERGSKAAKRMSTPRPQPGERESQPRRSWRCRASEPFLPYSRVSRETSEHRPLSLSRVAIPTVPRFETQTEMCPTSPSSNPSWP